MKVKVFYPNREGKIEFTRQELEKLLDEVYREGQKDCNCSKSWTWTTPYCNTRDLNLSSDSTSNATITTSPNLTTATYTADSATNAIDDFKAESINDTKPFTISMKLNEADINKAAETIQTMLNQRGTLTPKKIDDVFSGLAKELNF